MPYGRSDADRLVSKVRKVHERENDIELLQVIRTPLEVSEEAFSFLHG